MQSNKVVFLPCSCPQHMGNMYQRETCTREKVLKKTEKEKNDWLTEVLLETEGRISKLPTECLTMIAEFVPLSSLNYLVNL